MNVSFSARRTVACVGTAAAAVAVVATSAVPASAAPAASTVLKVRYNAVGSSTVLKTGSVIGIGPTKLTTSLDPVTGAFTASLPIPPADTSFKLLGLLPVTATASFIPVGKVTGALKTVGTTTTVSSTATYTIKLTNVKVAGIDVGAGTTCQSKAPVTIALATPDGQEFNVTTGGVVSGSYTIGDFANCGLTTGLLNLLIPGPNNPVSVTLSKGKIIP